MTGKRKLQIAVDLSMTALLPVLMSYQLVGEAAHEWLGIAMGLLFAGHHLLNRHWHKSLFKGRYTALRGLGTAIDILLCAVMLALMISGVLLSKHIFHLPGSIGLSAARTAHLLASYWGFVLMSVHLGLHAGMILVLVKRIVKKEYASSKSRLIGYAVSVLLCGYGIYAFIKRQLGTYMLLKSTFVFFDFSEPLALFLLDYAATMAMIACLSHYISKLISLKKP
ncbi:DUF4405 domain-containing protein [Acutalibacter muris]|uniref:DUF4405 domain-containing protein n=1 Tax=Acutalibacter muris TaxID=1796620 RepID=UPI001C3EECDC|nr:DUF4405 domain-containing protein [Acutalibacter muris]